MRATTAASTASLQWPPRLYPSQWRAHRVRSRRHALCRDGRDLRSRAGPGSLVPGRQDPQVDAEGGVPADNPFPNSPVYSDGHRNPQGLAWEPQSGALFASRHGPTGEFGLSAYDEINVIRAGGNYGWPRVVCAPGLAHFVDPIFVWTRHRAASRAGLLPGRSVRCDVGRRALSSVSSWRWTRAAIPSSVSSIGSPTVATTPCSSASAMLSWARMARSTSSQATATAEARRELATTTSLG